MKIPKRYVNRQAEITESFLNLLNKHMDNFMIGRADQMVSLKQIVGELYLHPVHVTNVIKLHTGNSPCYFYEIRILEEAKKLLADPQLTITNVAHKLTYDKSNFTKFFKQFQGTTPSEYRYAMRIENDKEHSLTPVSTALNLNNI